MKILNKYWDPIDRIMGYIMWDLSSFSNCELKRGPEGFI